MARLKALIFVVAAAAGMAFAVASRDQPERPPVPGNSFLPGNPLAGQAAPNHDSARLNLPSSMAQEASPGSDSTRLAAHNGAQVHAPNDDVFGAFVGIAHDPSGAPYAGIQADNGVIRLVEASLVTIDEAGTLRLDMTPYQFRRLPVLPN